MPALYPSSCVPSSPSSLLLGLGFALCLTEYARSLTMSSPRMFLPVPTPPSIWLWSWPFRTLQRVLHFRMNPCTLGWYLPLLVKDAPGALQPSDGDRPGEHETQAPEPICGARPEESRVPGSSSSSSREARGATSSRQRSPPGAPCAARKNTSWAPWTSAATGTTSPPACAAHSPTPNMHPKIKKLPVSAVPSCGFRQLFCCAVFY